jgi:hypothetical protein
MLRTDPDLAFSAVLQCSLAFTLTATQARGLLVLSFFDVAFPDQLPSPGVAKLIERAALSISHSGVWLDESFAARVFVQPNLDPAAEVLHLKTALLGVVGNVVSELQNVPPVNVRPPQPVKIFQTRGARGWRYTLHEDDRRTLENILGRSLPGSMGIADDTRDAYVAFAPVAIEQVVAEALSGVSFGQLRAFGGVTIIDTTSAAIVWRSDPAPAPPAE